MMYGWMQRQFHAGELKSLARLHALRAMGVYEVFGLWQGETLIAYALLGHTPDKTSYLLDYFAVLPEHQDCGWGGRCLALLRETLTGAALLLEVEDPDYAPDEAEFAHFKRRIRFYERNGCLPSPVKVKLFGFDYAIMQLPLERTLAESEVRASMEALYHALIPSPYYEENVFFRDGDCA